MSYERYHKPGSRPHVIGCGAFGGRSRKTGKPVGERHRWAGARWGEGRCEYCGHYLEEVQSKPMPATGTSQ
jgi:hypothetical protein